VVGASAAWVVPLVSAGLCLIWSFERGQWWRPNSAGYTSDISEAGRYPLLAALRICSHSLRSDPSKDGDAMIPLWEGIE
jgi:hypothetical protein